VLLVPREALEALQATVTIDITPKSPFDRFAQEQTIENLLKLGLFQPQRIGELEVYVSVLDDDSVAPKGKLQEAIRHIRREQQRIGQIQAQGQLLQQQVRQMLEEQATGDIVGRGHLRYGMIATGDHSHLDSLRGAPPRRPGIET
jgi:hypothetical protein